MFFRITWNSHQQLRCDYNRKIVANRRSEERKKLFGIRMSESKINQPYKRHNESIFLFLSFCDLFFVYGFFVVFISFSDVSWTRQFTFQNKINYYLRYPIHYLYILFGGPIDRTKIKSLWQNFWSCPNWRNWHPIESHAWRDAIRL